MPTLYELVRTVDHVYSDGSEGVVLVKALQSDTAGECVIVADEGDGSVMIHSAEQADRLIRAIAAAAAKLGWEEIETVELAQKARRARFASRGPRPSELSEAIDPREGCIFEVVDTP